MAKSVEVAVPNVAMTLQHIVSRTTYSTKSGIAGAFEFGLLPEGFYVLNGREIGIHALRIQRGAFKSRLILDLHPERDGYCGDGPTMNLE